MKSGTHQRTSLRKKAIIATMIAGACLFGAAQADAALVSPVQSTAKPLGLSIAAPVNQAGSDLSATEFMNQLPAILSKIQTLLPEQKALSNPASMALNPSSLLLSANADVRIYFVKEGAANHNTLALNVLTTLPTVSTPAITSNAKLIFPDVSTSAPGNYNSTGNSVRTSNEPLLPGDFVDLGQISAGSLLDFVLIASGATGGKTVLTGETARNSTGLQHMVAFTVPGTNYTYFSFEDSLNGGDKDYNDAVFALQITYTPEPSTWAGMTALGLYAGYGALSRRKQKAATLAA